MKTKTTTASESTSFMLSMLIDEAYEMDVPSPPAPGEQIRPRFHNDCLATTYNEGWYTPRAKTFTREKQGYFIADDLKEAHHILVTKNQKLHVSSEKPLGRQLGSLFYNVLAKNKKTCHKFLGLQRK